MQLDNIFPPNVLRSIVSAGQHEKWFNCIIQISFLTQMRSSGFSSPTGFLWKRIGVMACKKSALPNSYVKFISATEDL